MQRRASSEWLQQVQDNIPWEEARNFEGEEAVFQLFLNQTCGMFMLECKCLCCSQNDAGQNNPSFYTILCSHQMEGSDRREDHAVEQQDRAGDEDQPVKGHIRACGPSQSETTKIALPIFSVKVRAKGQQEYVQTYAFLDSETT